ncbi:hypothetical protein S40293_04796 [Stachybotrys chartarum IBT 40293]|nr:hypothetical protein S40293_04796 [Stachybotrys chartarum IBT 40293]
MSRLSGWFRSSVKISDDADASIDHVDKEKENIQNAMQWAGMILNDDIDGAWENLQKGDSSFHELGSAVTFFMRSVLGFEKQVMLDTAQRLAECERRASADLRAAQKHGAARSGAGLYPPGTEYELVRAETQLMGAVVGVLNESLVEALKGFYGMRKAFYTLDAIIAIEDKKLGADSGRAAAAAKESLAKKEHMPGGFDDDGSDSDFVDAKEDLGTASPEAETVPSTAATTPERAVDSRPASPLHAQSQGLAGSLDIADNPVDVFIHSGSNMCFGVIMLILSIVPPAFSRILSIVGFQGDRARGVRLLWTSAACPNVNGAVAAMVLLAYYGGLMGFVDILPADRDFDEDAEIVGPPKERCARLLESMQARYPESGLWRLDKARQLANERRLSEAIEVGRSGKESKMKQVTALIVFELAINSMYAQRWEVMRDAFLRCLETNNWSTAMYNYLVAAAIIELYRDAHHRGDEAEALAQKKLAEEYLLKIHETANKKRMRGKPLPFDKFVQRKLNKWEERARALGVDLVDAVGASPALEMSFIWNGQKRMSARELETGLGLVAWERCTAGAEAVERMKRETDEMAVWAVSKSVLVSRLGRLDEARTLLKEHVLCHDRSVFKGSTKDDYVLPAATYELGVMAWMECCNPPDLAGKQLAEYRRQKAAECREYLDKVKVWEAFVLDARIGLRVQSGLETLQWFRRKMGWE